MPDGVSVWHKVSGKPGAPVVAYLHGGPGYNAFAFEKSAGELLERQFRVLYIDQRGCGRSGFEGSDAAYGMARTVEDIDRIRKAVGAEHLGLIGHSFGGVIAAEYARRYPQNVSSIVMVDTTPRIERALAHQVSFVDGIAESDFPAKAEEVHSLSRGEGSTFDKLKKLYGLLGRLPLQARLHYASKATQTEMEALDEASGVMACTSPRVASTFEKEGYLGATAPDAEARLPVPSLLVAGRSSEVIGKANIEAAALIWGAEVRWIDGAGHFVYFEKPREFAAAVTGFFAASTPAP
ncbi:MAG: alpha/beta hydrolase [Labilithrix sp.]|nr:alpha/beta hydrolase [Labilithrix sp.]